MSKPIVAIVGRPNVGKSTLFNRLIKKRDAIVDDVAGVTRDRHYAETEWSGREFQVIDTGGYLPQADNEMDLAIREQVEIALEESDVVLFVVDVKTGITDIDLDIAEKLKRSDKHVHLIVNKIDNEYMELNVYEFVKLGLSDPIPVSAMQGRGTGDLLDLVIADFPEEQQHVVESDEIINVAIIGKENVGKSSLVNTLVGKERVVVTDIPGTTRDSIDTLFKYNKKKYLLIDTAGLKRKTKIKENLLFYSQLRTMKSLDRADVVLYMIDVNDGMVRQDMRIIQEIVDSGKPILVAFNKWDLIEKDGKTYDKINREIKERLGQMTFILTEFISVYDKTRLYRVFDVMWNLYKEQQKMIKTSQLNKYFIPIIEKTPPPSVQGKEIKIKFVSQASSKIPTFIFFCNHPKLIVEHYKRFLENRLREKYGFKGIPIRIYFRNKN